MIAIYGGSFDPFHQGHYHVTQWLIASKTASRVIIVPTFQNPLKKTQYGATAKERLRMIELSLADLKNIEISRFEIDRAFPSYTVDTLRHFTSRGSLLLVIGSDAAFNFARWKSQSEILRLCSLLIVRRGEFDYEAWARDLGLPEPIGDTLTHPNGNFVTVRDIGAVNISATSLRIDIAIFFRSTSHSAEPQGIQHLVWKYIKENKLYSDAHIR